MDKTAAYQETLATLRRDLADAETRTQQLREAIKVILQLIPQEELFPSRARTAPVRNGLMGLTMVDAAERVLNDAGRPMHIMQIVKEMLNRGFQYDKEPEALRASLTGSIERKPVFQRVAPATYGLAVWTNGNVAPDSVNLGKIQAGNIVGT